jgi:hypothetical protein
MSDLRTRIAFAIQVRWLDLTLTDTWDENCLMLADAVIRELNLGIPCATDGCRMRKIAMRSAEKLGITEVDDSG